MNRFPNRLFSRRQPSPDIRAINNLDTPLGQQVTRIYEQSFPEAEREPIEEIAATLAEPEDGSSRNHLHALVEQDEAIGFTYFSSFADYYLGFLQFIAVRSDIRSKGHGSILIRDAMRQLRADGIQATGWPYLGMVLEIERPELAESAEARRIRERRIGFYQRNGAVMLEGIDYVAPPVAPEQPSLPFHLMLIRAVPKFGMHRWLRPKAVKALLIEGYGEDPDSWFIQHALEVRDRVWHAR